MGFIFLVRVRIRAIGSVVSLTYDTRYTGEVLLEEGGLALLAISVEEAVVLVEDMATVTVGAMMKTKKMNKPERTKEKVGLQAGKEGSPPFDSINSLVSTQGLAVDCQFRIQTDVLLRLAVISFATYCEGLLSTLS